MKRLIGTALAGRVAALEQDHHALAGFLDPGLQLQQFDLQPVLLLLVVAARHQVAIGIVVVAGARVLGARPAGLAAGTAGLSVVPALSSAPAAGGGVILSISLSNGGSVAKS
jgi:hypothetical protein